MSKLWSKWESALSYVKPDTVKRWHRLGFSLYWNRKSRKGRRPGRPKTDSTLRRLIRQSSRANPFWGTPMIQKVLALLGYKVSTSTIWKYLDRSGKEPSMTWRAFLKNHALCPAGHNAWYSKTAEETLKRKAADNLVSLQTA